MNQEDALVSGAKDDAAVLEKAASKDEIDDINDPILEQNIRTKETSYQLMREELFTAVGERKLDPLNKVLTKIMTVNLQDKGNVENAKKVLMELCQKEMEKAIKSKILQELRECINKINQTCVGEMAQEQAWFIEGQQVLQKQLQEIQGMAQTLKKKDETNVGKPPDHVTDVLFAAFILLGESEEELDTWQKVDAKLKEKNEEHLLDKLNSFDNSLLTAERVKLAEEKMNHSGGKLGDNTLIKTLHEWCLEKIKFYQTRGRLKKRN